MQLVEAKHRGCYSRGLLGEGRGVGATPARWASLKVPSGEEASGVGGGRGGESAAAEVIPPPTSERTELPLALVAPSVVGAAPQIKAQCRKPRWP